MITETKIIEIENYLNTKFDESNHRLIHIYNVKKMAISLAMIYHADINSVIAASYLHDATKHETNKENLRLAGIVLDEDVPNACLHAYAASKLAKTKFNITDSDILNAIKYHCSGRARMSLLEKIIYVSDFIEEGRDFVDEDLRDLAKKDLDLCVLKIMLRTKNYILKNNKKFSNLTEQAIQYYQNKGEING
ncbi:MAG: bis(5'-nucleosyl)-tetraphosphatase (symmetrical) YqeK [Tenericutes bacterium]|nr:bis(5'-nucleosyl)-tetraphosphatase (symmetrical) YqeK [Mycoplasmatota bacterium]